MLRLLVALILLANGVFFGWVQGWFGTALPPPRQGEHEPARLAAQLHPEAVTVLPAGAASAAVSAARAAAARCLQAGPLGETELAAVQAAVAAASIPASAWTTLPLPSPPRWLVVATRLADATARRAREAEFKRLNLDVQTLQTLEAPPELAQDLVLSRHASQEEADAALATLRASVSAKVQRGLKVVALPAVPAQAWLRVPQADPLQQVRLVALPGAALAGGFKPCPVP
jgi:hypothetical protein